MTHLWHALTRLGRITLWLLLPPIGLWRSYRHGQERRKRAIIETLRAAK